jgi:hypothetical protein
MFVVNTQILSCSSPSFSLGPFVGFSLMVDKEILGFMIREKAVKSLSKGLKPEVPKWKWGMI